MKEETGGACRWEEEKCIEDLEEGGPEEMGSLGISRCRCECIIKII
jgi:hypothetical protein